MFCHWSCSWVTCENQVQSPSYRQCDQSLNNRDGIIISSCSSQSTKCSHVTKMSWYHGVERLKHSKSHSKQFVLGTTHSSNDIDAFKVSLAQRRSSLHGVKVLYQLWRRLIHLGEGGLEASNRSWALSKQDVKQISDLVLHNNITHTRSTCSPKYVRAISLLY